MLQLSRISAKVWYAGVGLSGTIGIKTEEIGYLDYQVLQWRQRMPGYLQLPSAEASEANGAPNESLWRLQYLMHLRANRLRMFIYRPVLQSSAYMTEHKDLARAIVELAKDSVRLLERLPRFTKLRYGDKIIFNSFLVSATAILFLAACQQPSVYVADVRSEFTSALDLMTIFATPASLSSYLSTKIKSLRDAGMRLGLIYQDQNGSPTMTDDLGEDMTANSFGPIDQEGLNRNIDPPAFGDVTGFSVFDMQVNNELASHFHEAMAYNMSASTNMDGNFWSTGFSA